jgi:hypothetical protein
LITLAHSRIGYEPLPVEPPNLNDKGEDNMKKVIIEMRKGQPVIVSCPKKVEVVFRQPKKKTLQKQYRTALYHVKSFLGLV